MSDVLVPPARDAAAPPASSRGRWVGVPRRGDPRIPFAALMTLYALVGTTLFTFNRSPLQLLAIVASGCLLDMFLHWAIKERRLLFPLSAYISSVSLGLILGYSHSIWFTLFPVYLTIASKYVLTLRGRHAFNPSLFGVVGSLLLAGTWISAAPAYQWGTWWFTSTFMVAAAVMMFLTKVGRGWLVASFLLFYVLQTALRAWLLRHHVPPDVLFVGTLTTPPFFLFAFFMITDPATSPPSRRGQVGIAAAITLVDLWYHTMWSVFTFFYAAATVAAVRFAWGHLRVLREHGVRSRIAQVRSSRWPRAALVIALLGAGGAAAWATVIHPTRSIDDAGFRFTEVAPGDSGLELELDASTLELVDERVQHVAKWMLSVGAGAYVDDVDSDGRVDLLVTSPLAVADDRVVLFRNVTEQQGDLRFERVDVPALARFGGAPREVGLASGALFLDHDDDGDRDLLVLAAFGEVRLLRNDTEQGGRIRYVDVTAKAGVDEYLIGVAANAIDYDRDGDLDVLLGEILPNRLAGYEGAARFNVFDLPDPEYDGDRRALRFMHESWDDAVNGGENVMYRNDGDGTFTRVRGSELGMPQTHYTLAIGTADFNDDGWTDLYLASDFGRDDLYVNEGGERFRRIQGWLPGSIGRDTYKGMNSTIADLDRDGRQDVYVSNVHQELQAEGSLLWMNLGMADGTSEHDPPGSAGRWPAPRFADEATIRGVLNEDRFGWGADAGDLDNDGWTDLVQANGMVGDKLDELADGETDDGCPDYWYVNQKLMQSGPEVHGYADKWGDLRGRCIYPDEAQRAYLNLGDRRRGQFVDVAGVAGLERRGEGRGTALADFDDDGWLDLVVTMQHEPPLLLSSTPTERGADRTWVKLRLRGDGRNCSRDATGSIVEVDAVDGRRQLHEVRHANGFSSQRDPRIHVGLGARVEHGDAVRVDVRWCGSERRERFEVSAGATHDLVQGAGRGSG